MTQRERTARSKTCTCGNQALNFCGSWVHTKSKEEGGYECLRPICRTCADIRGNVWLCPTHSNKPKSKASPKHKTKVAE